MEKKTLVTKALGFLKQAFEIEDKEAKKESFLDAVLEDGTEIEISGEDIVVGAEVFIKTAEGLSPAPDGEHILDSGISIMTEAGIITDVVDPNAEPTEEETEPAEEEMSKFATIKSMKALQSEFNELKDKYVAIEKKLKAQEKAITEFTEKFSGLDSRFEDNKELYSEIKGVLETLSKVPLASELKPKRSTIKQGKQNFNQYLQHLNKN